MNPKELIAIEGQAGLTFMVTPGLVSVVEFKSAGVMVSVKAGREIYLQIGESDADFASMHGYCLSANESQRIYLGFKGVPNRMSFSSDQSAKISLLFYAYLQNTYD